MGEATSYRLGAYWFISPFQSTLPVGEATVVANESGNSPIDFNPRFPWGKRPVRPSKGEEQQHFNPRFPWGKRHEGYDVVTRSDYISIHASRGGSDISICKGWTISSGFQSTLPVGEATYEGYDVVTRSDYISIHASRGGSDLKSARLARRMTVFQSTLPVGEATILTKYAEFA